MGIVIRGLRPEDRPCVVEALTDCAAFTAEEVRVALELFDAGIEGGYSFFGADEEGTVQGYVCLGKAPLTQSTWYLYWICVHPRVQHLGVGRDLQRHSEEFVQSQGGQMLVLETSGRPAYRRARSFYESAGYVQAGLIRNFYRPGDDCVIYAKNLT